MYVVRYSVSCQKTNRSHKLRTGRVRACQLQPRNGAHSITASSSGKKGSWSSCPSRSVAGSATRTCLVDLLRRRTRTATNEAKENMPTTPKSGNAQAATLLDSFFPGVCCWTSADALESYKRGAGAGAGAAVVAFAVVAAAVVAAGVVGAAVVAPGAAVVAAAVVAAAVVAPGATVPQGLAGAGGGAVGAGVVVTVVAAGAGV